MSPRPPAAPPRLLSALFVPLAMLLFPPAAGSACDAPLEFRGRWTLFLGPFRPSGELVLRRLDDARVSLRVELPEWGLLPRAQVLARDGAPLLSWTEPAGARSPLGEDDPLVSLLANLAAPEWEALLAGRDPERLLADASPAPGGGTAGRLGSWPAWVGPARGGRRRARVAAPGGPLELFWRERPAARRTELDLKITGKPLLRLSLRPCESRPLEVSDWLHLDERANFREPEGR